VFGGTFGMLHVGGALERVWGIDWYLKARSFEARGDYSLLYFAYTCVRDLFIGGVIYLAKKIIR
jgi:hypothetical protein